MIGPLIVCASCQEVTAFVRAYFGCNPDQIARRDETRRLRRLSSAAGSTGTIPKNVRVKPLGVARRDAELSCLKSTCPIESRSQNTLLSRLLVTHVEGYRR